MSVSAGPAEQIFPRYGVTEIGWGEGDRHFFLFVISKFSGVEFHTWDFLRCGVLLNSTQSPPALGFGNAILY